MIRNDVFDIIKIFHKNNSLQMLNIVTNGWFVDKMNNIFNKSYKRATRSSHKFWY